MFVVMLKMVLRYINFQVVLSVLGKISAMIKRNKWNFKEIGFFVFFFKEECTGLLQAFLTLAEKEGISIN